MSVFKPTYATELPENATIHKSKGRSYINIKDHNGRTVKAFLTKDEMSYLKPQRNYAGRYKDYHGKRRTITLCQEKEASQAALNELSKYIELLRAHRAIPPLNEVSPMIRNKVQEALIASGQEGPESAIKRKSLTALFDMYLSHLEASGVTGGHRKQVKRCLKELASICKFKMLSDICQPPIKDFINNKKESGLSNRTVNFYIDRIRAFCKWAYASDLLNTDPLKSMKRLNEKIGRVREARSMTPDEIDKLLIAASERPITEFKKRGAKQLKAKTIKKYAMLGEERKLAYSIMLYAGLRVNETRNLLWGDIDFEKKIIKTRASITKNAKDATLPLHSYLENLLKDWRNKHPELKSKDVVVSIPKSNSSFLKVFNRDLEFSGIEKIDDSGRVLHLHALRHSYTSLLARQGVHPHVLQRLARHAKVETTLSVYTHVLHGDDISAIESLNRPKEKVAKTQKKRTG